MNINELLTLPESEWLTELKNDSRNIQKFIDYHEGKHPIRANPNRQDYYIPKYKVGEDGNFVEKDGKRIQEGSTLIERKRIVLNYQKRIVETAVGMCVGSPVTLTLNNGDTDEKKAAFNEFVDMWRNKTRLDMHSIKMAERLFVESKCAEVFFIDDADINKDIKVNLWCKENGDEIWAHFDDNKKLDAITRQFTKRVIKNNKADNSTITQIWTAEAMLEKVDDAAFISKANPYKKIPIVWYDQKLPEFNEEQMFIDILELVKSQFSDVNKRVGNPNVVIDGQVTGMPDIEQDVKVWNTVPTEDNEGKKVKSSVSYLQMNGAPEAIKIEIEQLYNDIFRKWPDLSFLLTAIKTGNLSGTAIKLMFTGTSVQVALKRAIFEDFSRRVSILKRIMAVKENRQVFEELNISVSFNSILPDNVSEIVDTIAAAKMGGFIPTIGAVQANPLNANNPDAYNQLQEETSRELGGTSE